MTASSAFNLTHVYSNNENEEKTSSVHICPYPPYTYTYLLALHIIRHTIALPSIPFHRAPVSLPPPFILFNRINIMLVRHINIFAISLNPYKSYNSDHLSSHIHIFHVNFFAYKYTKKNAKQEKIDEPLELVHFFAGFVVVITHYICSFIESAPGAAPVAVLLLCCYKLNAPVCFLFVQLSLSLSLRVVLH